MAYKHTPAIAQGLHTPSREGILKQLLLKAISLLHALGPLHALDMLHALYALREANASIPLSVR